MTTLHVGTRKGLFTIRRRPRGWEIDRVDFLGQPVTMLLAMGSSTGGLWISDNAGDDWHCLSHVLPPIYVTRFSRRLQA